MLGGRHPADAVPPPFDPEAGATRVEVPLGRRVMVVSATSCSPRWPPRRRPAVTAELARALDTWDGPGILIIAGNLFDLTGSATSLAEAPSRSLEAHPAAASGPQPVPRRRRAAGHPPDRHPRAGLRHRSAGHGGHGRPGGRAARPGRPPPPHRHRGPGRAGGAGRARLRLGVQRAGDGVRPGGRRQARGHRAHPGRTGLAVAGRPCPTEDAPWLDRARPAERPFGAVPVRGVPHALPPPGPLRLVAAGPLRGGRPAPGGGDPLGARPPRVGVAGPGHPPRPHRRLRGPDRGGADRGAGGAGRPGRRPRAAEPSDVVDPRRWRPGRGAVGGRGQRHRPRRRPPAGRVGATPG